MTYYIVKPYIPFSTFEVVEQYSVYYFYLWYCIITLVCESFMCIEIVDVVPKLVMHVSLLCGCRIFNSSPMKLLLYCTMTDYAQHRTLA